MPGAPKRTGPVALTTNLATNVLQGGGGSALIYDVITKIHVVNKTPNVAKFSLWVGATGANAAGTELYNAESVPGNSSWVRYMRMPMKSTDFLVGGADTATALTIEIDSEQYVVP